MKMRFYLGFLCLTALSACFNEDKYTIDSVEVNPTLALPLISGDLSIQDLLKNTDSVYVKVYPDDLVYLSYSQTLKSQDITDLFEIPDKILNRSFIMVGATLPPLSKDLRSDSIQEVVDLNLTPEQLSEISYKSGDVTYSTSVTPGNPNLKYEVNISLPDFTSKTTGKPLNLYVNGSGSLQLSDYIVKLNKNKFNLKLVLVLKKNTSSVVIVDNTFVNVKLSFLGMDFYYVKGFFGEQSKSIPAETVEIGAFGTALDDATVSFAQPKINFEVINDFGVPCQVDFKKLEGQKGGQSIGLVLDPPNPVSVAYPDVLGASAVTPVDVVNAKQVLDFAPSSFYYQIDANINKGLTSGNNFLADTSKLRVKMDVEVPLYGHASNIYLLDTIDLNLNDVDESAINSASLNMKAVNEMPLDAYVQFYLLDENFVLLDSVLQTSQTNLVKGSKVSASGELLAPGIVDQMIELEKSKVDQLFLARYIITAARMNTSKNDMGALQDVKFKSKYKLTLNLGLLAYLKLTAEL